MGENAQFVLGGKNYEFPVIEGTEQEKAVDITKLRGESSYVTIDNGYGNTGSCLSSVTFLDGEKGILRYRGYPIEQIAENLGFLETSYLLIYDKLPTVEELEKFKVSFSQHYAISSDLDASIKTYPENGHPMGAVSAAVCSLSGYHSKILNTNLNETDFDEAVVQLLAKITTISASIYKNSVNQDVVEPRPDLDYISNFLHMMFSTKDKQYEADSVVVDAMRALLILHADHEQNCSTSAVRLVGSSWANLFASISGGICALWGPLHGGANQKVLEMLEEIHNAGGDVEKFISKAKDPDDNYRLMGFGHRVYKNFDPRATIIKKKAHEVFAKMGVSDPLLDIAVKLEEIVLKDEYFVKRKLYPNVDFYSGLIYKAIGIPTDMFTVLFAIGRMPGWIAHWKEMKEDPKAKIGRPRQIYTGATERDLVAIDKR